MIISINSKRTPPPPHRETLVSGARGGTRLLAAFFAAALLFASCEKPTGPSGDTATGKCTGKEPTEEVDRYTFTQKPDGSYKLTVKECVTTIPQGEFSTFDASASGITKSPILQRLAASSGKAITAVLTEIELPSTLKTIEKGAFYLNTAVTGNFTIPRNVTTIGDSAFTRLGADNFIGRGAGNIASSQAPAITFETGSKLTDIGRLAFNNGGSKRALVLPEDLETIGVRAFSFFVMPAAALVIPANVSIIGEGAFSAFRGINDDVTIRSAKLAKVGTNSPLGNDLFGGVGTTPRLSTITTIKLPLAVYNSYSSAERTAIFGSEVTAYQDLEGNPHPTE